MRTYWTHLAQISILLVMCHWWNLDIVGVHVLPHWSEPFRQFRVYGIIRYLAYLEDTEGTNKPPSLPILTSVVNSYKQHIGPTGVSVYKVNHCLDRLSSGQLISKLLDTRNVSKSFLKNQMEEIKTLITGADCTQRSMIRPISWKQGFVGHRIC